MSGISPPSDGRDAERTVHGITYPNISHDRVLPQGQADALSWLADRFAGRPARNDC